MPRAANGVFSRLVGTTAIPGQVITDEIFNDAMDDIALALSESERVSEARDLGAVVTTTGTGSAYVLTLGTPWDTAPNGLLVGFRVHVPNTGACVLTAANVTGPLRAVSGADLSSGDLPARTAILATLNLQGASAIVSGTLTTNSNQVTGVSSVAGLYVGQTVTASGIAAGTTISAISGTSLSLSKAFTGATGPALITAVGPEWLLVNGGLLATAARLAVANGQAPVSLTADAQLDAAAKGTAILATGSVRVRLPAPTVAGAGYVFDLRNDGIGDVTLSTQAVDFTGSVASGNATIFNVSSTTGLAVGMLLTMPPAPKSFTGTLTANSAVITAVTDVSGLAVGQPVSSIVAGFPGGAAIVAFDSTTVTISAPFTGTTTTNAAITATVDGILPGTTITAIAGNTVSLSQAYVGATFVTAALSAYGTAVDGLPFFILYPGETRRVMCDGTTFRSIVTTPFYREWFGSGRFVRPPGYARIGYHAVAPGGGGGFQGGGGGEGTSDTMPASSLPASMLLTIGAAGAPSATTGSDGGVTILGTLATLAGGKGGTASGAAAAAGGGTADGINAGGAGSGSGTNPVASINGGGGGGNNIAGATVRGGSLNAGAGGRFPNLAPGPGGGGYGSATNGVAGSAGGPGRVRIWGVA